MARSHRGVDASRLRPDEDPPCPRGARSRRSRPPLARRPRRAPSRSRRFDGDRGLGLGPRFPATARRRCGSPTRRRTAAARRASATKAIGPARASAAKGDYYLIQFGHNDQPGKGPERETDPATTSPPTWRATSTRCGRRRDADPGHVARAPHVSGPSRRLTSTPGRHGPTPDARSSRQDRGAYRRSTPSRRCRSAIPPPSVCGVRSPRSSTLAMAAPRALRLERHARRLHKAGSLTWPRCRHSTSPAIRRVRARQPPPASSATSPTVRRVASSSACPATCPCESPRSPAADRDLRPRPHPRAARTLRG